MREKYTIDVEPTWTEIINWISDNTPIDKSTHQELLKLAKVGDLVRKAQKDNLVLVLTPQGKAYTDDDVKKYQEVEQ